MKKLMYFKMLLFAATSAIALTVSAQRTNSRSNINGEEDKQQSAQNAKADQNETGSLSIHPRALKSFSQTYKNSKDVRWFADTKTIVASFNDSERRYRVIYYPNGKWLHTMITYDERFLPDNIKSLAQSNYPKFKISSVIEIHEGDLIVYFITMEDDRRFKQVVVHNDQVFTYKQFVKNK